MPDPQDGARGAAATEGAGTDSPATSNPALLPAGSPAPSEDSGSVSVSVVSATGVVSLDPSNSANPATPNPNLPSSPTASSTPRAPEVDPYIGKLIAGRFKVLGQLGKGGMGQVYKAEQLPLGRPVALKVMNPTYATSRDPEYEKRFFLEASIASKLTHPNTITVFDYGKSDDTFFIAMEYLSGRTLGRALSDDGVFSSERAIHVAMQIAKGLREAHQQGVIHRDLKPANVMLIDHNDDKDFAKVLDFGLVKLFNQPEEESKELTMTGIFLGSPKYMSPEQIRNQQPDPRSDVYSLGVILFQMVTGRVPFVHDMPVNVMLMHLNDPIPIPSVLAPGRSISPAMDSLILRCLQKERTDRFDSMDALLHGLRAVRTEISPTSGSSTSAISVVPHQVLSAARQSAVTVEVPVQEQPRSNVMPAVAASVAAAVVGILLAALLTDGSPAPRPQPPVGNPSVVTQPAVSPPGAAARAIVVVNSTPAGASVMMGEKLLGSTPLVVDIPSPGTPGIQLNVGLQGHEPQVVDVSAVDGRFLANVVLKPAAAPQQPPQKNGKSPRPRKEKRSNSSDFKDDPY